MSSIEITLEDIGIEMPECTRPSIAYAPTGLFEGETQVLMQYLRLQREYGSLMDVMLDALQDLQDGDHIYHGTSIALYYALIQGLVNEGNGDSSSKTKIFSQKTGYQGLLKSEEASYLINFCASEFSRKIWEMLQKLNPDLEIDQNRNVDTLFFSESKSGMSGHPSIFGLSQISSNESSDEEDFDDAEMYEFDIQAIEEVMTMHLELIQEKLSDIRDHICQYSADPEQESQSEDLEKETDLSEDGEILESPSSTSRSLTITEIVQEKIKKSFPGGKFPLEEYSSLWFTPPPITPVDLFTFEKISGEEASFFLDSFTDVYQSETILLSIHFIIRRLQALWAPSIGRKIESALFSHETPYLLECLSNLSPQVAKLFTTRFLAMEGITVPGEKMSLLGNDLFTERNTLNISRFLSDMLEMIRDGVLCTERLRVSLLYGRTHPSYVGDEFIRVFFGLIYQTRYLETGKETILSIAESLSTLSLPKDAKKTEQFYNGIQKRFPEEVRKLGVQELDPRKSYEHESDRRTTLSSRGVILPSMRSTPQAFELFDLQTQIWSRLRKDNNAKSPSSDQSVSGTE